MNPNTILACADGGLLCGPILLAGAGALLAYLKVSTQSETKPEGDKEHYRARETNA